MKKPLIALALLLGFASVLLRAQNTDQPPGPPSPEMRVQHHLKFLTTMLSLTSAQQQQATTIFTNAATAEESAHKNMRAAHQSLEDAVKANDSAAIDQAAATIGSLTTQLTATQAKARAAFYQILTPDQQNKLTQLDGPGGFMRHGPGPGPGFGPGPRP